jgi:hypothetical protein
MDRNQLDSIKEAIKAEYDIKISEATRDLTAERDNAIAALSLVEDRLYSVTSKSVVDKTISPVKDSMTVAARIRAALERMIGEFTTRDWIESINNDGMGRKIDRRQIAPYITRMKGNQIDVMREFDGNNPGIYKKRQTPHTQAVSSPAVIQDGLP